MANHKNLTLVPVEDSDINQIEIWLNRDHVKKWFEIPESNVYLKDWLAEVSKRNDEFLWISYFIVQLDGQPIGFALYYDSGRLKREWYQVEAKGEIYSMDYLIGETSNIGKGYGKEMMGLLTEKINKTARQDYIVSHYKPLSMQRTGVRMPQLPP